MKPTKAFFPFLLGLWFAAPSFAQTGGLAIDRGPGPVRLDISGGIGEDYVLERATEVGATANWQLLLSLALTNTVQYWLDSESGLASAHFYRLARLTNPPPPVLAQNFRLIDHLGRSHRLDYYLADPTVRSIVLVFTGNGCDKVHDLVSAIQSLRDQFSPQGVLFWMIDANAADNRSNIVAEANAQGIDLPILHDAAQLVAREYGASATPEAFALEKTSFGWMTNWGVFYRGAIDDRIGPSPATTTQYYLSNALAGLVAGQTAAIHRAKADGCAITFNPPPTADYSTDIVPLLQDKCLRCHSPGNIAPFAMTNYDVVHAYASLIKGKVLAGEMPPWHADPFYGSFTNDFSLSPQQAALLVQWINSGASRGTGPDQLAVSPPPPTNYPFAWPSSLGQPDLVLSIPQQTVSATGVEAYRYINVTTTFPTDTWIRAAVIRPGNRRVVHHCLVFFGSDSVTRGLLGFFAGYVPGYDPVAFPEDTAKLLPKGTVLQFQMHYTTTGQTETDQTEIGLYVSPSPPAYTLQTRSAPNISFTIPPNTRDYQTNASFTFAKNSMLYEMAPHMHLRGAWFRYEAVYPDNSREVLLSVPHYEFHWQTLYRLAQPRFMPAGTRLLCTGGWDNTSGNTELMTQYAVSGGDPLFSPDTSVRFGEQTFDEMFIGYFNFAEVP